MAKDEAPPPSMGKKMWLFSLSLLVGLVGVLAGIVIMGAWSSAGEGKDAAAEVLEAIDENYYVAPHLLNGIGKEKAPASAGSAAPELSIVIPAYNEEERLPIMLKEAFAYLDGNSESSAPVEATSLSSPSARKPRTGTVEILVVDDGSEDGTARQAVLAAGGGEPRVKVVRLKRNRGKGFAVKAGMLSARGKLRLMVDADGATQFSDLQKLERALAGTGEGDSERGVENQIAFGSRHHLSKDATVKRAWYRNIFMWGLHFLVRVLITANGQPIHDTQCGFKLFKSEAAEKMFATLHVHRWAFDLELVVLAQQYGFGIAEVPVTWHEVAGSKLSLVSATLNMLKDMLRIRLSYLTGVWKIKR